MVLSLTLKLRHLYPDSCLKHLRFGNEHGMVRAGHALPAANNDNHCNCAVRMFSRITQVPTHLPLPAHQIKQHIVQVYVHSIMCVLTICHSPLLDHTALALSACPAIGTLW